ncbi:MAG: transposase [Halanaerobiaceae bacterium]|nr:transposase [Halanaerobiaceae bacterium]
MGNIASVARRHGISKHTVYSWVKRLSLMVQLNLSL